MKAPRTRVVARGLILVLVTGCGGDTPVVPDPPVATTITVSPTPVDFSYLGQTRSLGATVLDQNGNPFAGAVTWSSNDPTVVSVTVTGIVGAVMNGSTEVVAALGSLTAQVTVTVEQVATQVGLVSGDAQEALAGSLLATPIVAVAWDLAGSPVPGTTVTFSPDPDHGSVSAASVQADANGEVETMWTLGTPFGPQCLVASIAEGEATFTAIARSDTPTPDLVPGGSSSPSASNCGEALAFPLIVTRTDPSSLEAVIVTTTVRNEGDGDTGSGFRVQLLDDGVEIATADFAPLAAGGEAVVEFAAGPFTAGQHALSVVLDADDALLELDETNNEASKSQFVTLQTAVSAGSPVAGLGGTTGNELLFRLVIPPGSPSTLTVELTGGTGDVDLFIEGDLRPPARDPGYNDCISAGPSTVERCQIISASGTYHIILHAFSTYSGTTMEITLGNTIIPFDIEVVFIDHGSPSQDATFLAAADRWEELIVGDIPDQEFTLANPLAADACINGQPAISGETIDDVRIYVSIESLDALASAGPCLIRGLSWLPVLGVMRFNSVDIERLEGDGDLEEVILHEMAHVLGLGTIWPSPFAGLLENPSLPDNQGADTHFRGPLAIEAFDAAGGAAYTGAKVPVENMAGPGSGDGHWRESVFGDELMTPFANLLGISPLSAITVQSLADLGYGVDASLADAFTLVLPAAQRAPAAGGRIIDFRGDIGTGPIIVIDRKGRMTRVHR